MTLSQQALQEKMRRCIALAQAAASDGNYALGALVVLNGEILTESGSSLIGDNNDPSAHPEMTVIREAAKKIGSRYLKETFLISTLEPCAMCTSVAIWAKMSGIAFGALQTDAKAWSSKHPDDKYTWRQIEMPARSIVEVGHPKLELHEAVLREECIRLFELNLHK